MPCDDGGGFELIGSGAGFEGPDGGGRQIAKPGVPGAMDDVVVALLLLSDTVWWLLTIACCDGPVVVMKLSRFPNWFAAGGAVGVETLESWKPAKDIDDEGLAIGGLATRD